MLFTFSGHIAANYGTRAAAVLQIIYDLSRMPVDGINQSVDGKTWVNGNIKWLIKHVPFLSEKQLQRTITNLIGKRAIYPRNLNENKFNRARWFALSDEIIDLINRGV